MKRAWVLLLAILLVLTGCSDKVKTKDISVKDVCCPYEIDHTKEAVEITLRDATQSGLLWNVEAIPEDICGISQENVEKEDTCRYLITGLTEGAAMLTFTAQKEEETTVFVLDLVIDVNAEGKPVVFSAEHSERVDVSVAENGLEYTWNVDVDGTLNFSFTNEEDVWFVDGDGDGVCILSNELSTPSGCKFSAQAKEEGKTAILLIGETTQRTIQVVIEVDDEGNLKVTSVQEQ